MAQHWQSLGGRCVHWPAQGVAQVKTVSLDYKHMCTNGAYWAMQWKNKRKYCSTPTKSSQCAEGGKCAGEGCHAGHWWYSNTAMQMMGRSTRWSVYDRNLTEKVHNRWAHKETLTTQVNADNTMVTRDKCVLTESACVFGIMHTVLFQPRQKITDCEMLHKIHRCTVVLCTTQQNATVKPKFHMAWRNRTCETFRALIPKCPLPIIVISSVNFRFYLNYFHIFRQ